MGIIFTGQIMMFHQPGFSWNKGDVPSKKLPKLGGKIGKNGLVGLTASLPLKKEPFEEETSLPIINLFSGANC